MLWLRPLFARLSLPDTQSIRFRLTAGVVLVSTLGIGGLTGWMSWRMEHLLLNGHLQSVGSLSQRFGEDVDLYHQTMPLDTALQKVIDHRAMGDTAIWVQGPDGDSLAQSATLAMGSWREAGLTQYLSTLSPRQKLLIAPVGDRYLVVCVRPLTVADETIGTLFVAEDITASQLTFFTMRRSLWLVSGGTIVLLTGLIALYVWRSLSPLKTLSHQVRSVTAHSLDATRLQLDQAPSEVRELAQTLDHTLERLAQAWQQQQRLVGDVSHELRTPLTLVQGYLQSTLRRCQTLTDPQREGLETAAAETEHTIAILNDLLVLARASMGHLPLSLERLDLKAIVLETVGMADVTGDRITTQVEVAPLWVRADANALRQILTHLVDNALTHSATTSPITVWVTQVEQCAQIQVIDHGRGIPLADQVEIFAPFYRVDSDRCRQTGGTGLGLAIVKTLVERMRGSVQVQSQPGAGSTFTVQIPLCQGASS